MVKYTRIENQATRKRHLVFYAITSKQSAKQTREHEVRVCEYEKYRNQAVCKWVFGFLYDNEQTREHEVRVCEYEKYRKQVTWRLTMSKIFVVMGKSASGKDTIYKRLLAEKSLNLKTIVPYTTRPIRQGETEGVEYFFVTQKDMRELESQGRIIECRCYNTVYGEWYYFTADDDQINLEEQDYLMITTLVGYEKIRDYYGEDKVIPIYIQVEDGLRLERALKREQQQAEPKYTEMCRRFIADSNDFSEDNLEAQKITKRYENVDFELCLLEIMSDIQREKRNP